MSGKNVMCFLLLAIIALCLTEMCTGYGYSPYYGGHYGLGHTGGYGTCGVSYSLPHSYACSHLSPCLKAKLLKKYIELKLKKPSYYAHHTPLALPYFQHRAYTPSYHHTCLSKPTACYKAATCLKYPCCGPCPYASCNKCLKHKASLALTS